MDTNFLFVSWLQDGKAPAAKKLFVSPHEPAATIGIDTPRLTNRNFRKNKSDVWGYFTAKYISVEGWPVSK